MVADISEVANSAELDSDQRMVQLTDMVMDGKQSFDTIIENCTRGEHSQSVHSSDWWWQIYLKWQIQLSLILISEWQWHILWMVSTHLNNYATDWCIQLTGDGRFY